MAGYAARRTVELYDERNRYRAALREIANEALTERELTPAEMEALLAKIEDIALRVLDGGAV